MDFEDPKEIRWEQIPGKLTHVSVSDNLAGTQTV